MLLSLRRLFSLSPSQYSQKVNLLLDSLSEQIEANSSSFVEDVTLSDGVLTVVCKGNRTYVLNKQTPNLQVWLSSPFS
jgi:frataxin